MTTTAPRWPAWAMAVLFLGYAVGKAAFAAQDRLGFPGGPPPAEDYFMDAATAQWLAAASGVLGAGVVLATLGRFVPRPVLLPALAVVLVAVLGGAGVMVVDGFVGIGVGWRWYHGVVGVLAIVLSVVTTWVYWHQPQLADSTTAGRVGHMSDSPPVVTPIFDQLVDEFRQRDSSASPSSENPATEDPAPSTGTVGP